MDEWTIYGILKDHVRPINRHMKYSKAQYIIITTNLFLKWLEVDPVKDYSTNIATRFIFKNIITLISQK